MCSASSATSGRRAGRYAALREAHVERVLGGEQLRRGLLGVRG